MKTIFWYGKKCLGSAQYVCQFLVWHKRIRPAQNILRPVVGLGIKIHLSIPRYRCLSTIFYYQHCQIWTLNYGSDKWYCFWDHPKKKSLWRPCTYYNFCAARSKSEILTAFSRGSPPPVHNEQDCHNTLCSFVDIFY